MNAVPVPFDRNAGLGASDAPAALGVSPWVTPLQLYQLKVGEVVPAPPSLPMQIGTALHPVILDALAQQRDLEVTLREYRFVDSVRPWRWVTVDGITAEAAGQAPNVLVEAKTASSHDGWGDEGTDEIPVHYMAQVQHGLDILGFELAIVPVLFFGRNLEVFSVRRDESLIRMIRDAEEEFWDRVVNRNPPDPVTAEDARSKFRKDNGLGIVADANVIACVDRLREIRAEMKDLEADEELMLGQIQNFMGEHSALAGPDGKVLATWKAGKPAERFDTKAFRAAHPALAAQFTNVGEASRRFLLK